MLLVLADSTLLAVFSALCCPLCVFLGLPCSRRFALQELTARAAHRILSAISDEDCRALGFNPAYSRPDWFLLSVLPVPPPPVRPSVMMDSSAR